MRTCVLDDWEAAAADLVDWAPVRALGELVIRQDHLASPDDLIGALQGFDVIVLMRERTRFPREVIEALPDLKLVVTTGPRNAVLDLEACTERGITVCCTANSRVAVVELTWALILGALQHIPSTTASMAAGLWQPQVGVELDGLRLGLLGLGRTGSRMARIAHAFGMEVLAWSENMTEEKAREHGARLVGKRELFEQSDIVSVHLLLSQRTRGLVGADELAALGPDSWLVNTSRGPIVDEVALIEACRAGTIAGAMLDVYDVEPLPADHPLRTAPRVLLTPHNGYATRQTLGGWYRDVVEDIVAFATGAPIRVLAAP